MSEARRREWVRNLDLIGASSILHYKGMLQQSGGSPSAGGRDLQAPRDEVPELPGRCGRGFRRLGHADGTHEAGPVPLAADGEGETTQIELENADSEAPNVAGVAIVLAVVEIGVDSLGAHVSDGADGGVAGIHGLGENSTDPKISDFDLVASVHEEVGGFDVAVDDPAAVEVGEADENLSGEMGEGALVADAGAFQGPPIHVLQQHLDLAVVIEHVKALDDVGVVDAPEDLDLAADLEADGIVVVAVDDLEGVESAGGTVADLVDGPAGAASDAVEALQLREVHEAVGGSDGGGGGGR